ncbi:unnamed protein product [Cuscuta campestris]|uniref:Uncharacterized protein n=1 Tax=Cuscuta campestris TaxID=132261 RepID=A0A484M9Z7_9ASTE|nr:unnamed protein product [Cuscuta campestris]
MKKVGDKLIPKTEDEFDAEDIKKVENYAKAINMLYCAVNPNDYRKISCCSTAKEMWDKLEVTYEGTDQVREAKIDFLTQEYEMFRMKEHKKIDDMFDRFSKIVNDLHALKKTYTDRDLVRKILRSLTSEWRSKADAIYESIGTSNVTIDSLRAGHIKNKCPKSGRNSRHFKRQRAYISWGGDSGDESTDQDEDETSNLCLMAHEDQTDDVQEHDHLLPYPFLVMDILERFKVTTTVGPLTKATKIWTISNQTFLKRSDNAAAATAQPRRTATAAGQAEPQARANLASIADSLNQLHLKVDGMGSYLERLDVAVQRQGYAMNSYFQGINYVPPPYHGTFFGQVYGDEDEADDSYAPSSSPDEDEFDDVIDGDEMDVDNNEEETEDED